MARYECKWMRAKFPKGAHVLEFTRMQDPVGVDKNGEKIFFGVLDTANPEILRAMPGETPESLDAWLQSRRQFKERVPGVDGVWLESERLGKVIVGHEKNGAVKTLMGYGEKMLRSILAAAGKSFPVTASLEELAIEASALDAQKFAPPPADPVAAVGAPDESEAPADQPGPKRKK